MYLGRHQVKLGLRRSQSKPSPPRSGSEQEAAHGRDQLNPSYSARDTFIIPLRGYWGTNALCLVSVVRLFRALHSSIHSPTTCLLVPILLPTHLSCIFPIRPSRYSFILSTTASHRSLLLSNRLHHPFRGLRRRHATPRPRFAALRHPIFLVSSLPTTWPSIALGRPPTAHPPTAYTHSLIHSFTYHSYDHHHSCGEEQRHTGIPRLGAFAFARKHPTDKSLGIGLQRTKKQAVSNTARHNTTTTQHIIP